jgi:hypothetical protein
MIIMRDTHLVATLQTLGIHSILRCGVLGLTGIRPLSSRRRYRTALPFQPEIPTGLPFLIFG